jgi:hypothetical protein
VQSGPELELDSKRPQPSDTPFWMRHIFGSVAEELRVPIALLVILAVIGTVLSVRDAPAASQVWDLVKAMIGGGVGGGLVARSVRNTRSRGR